MKTKRIRAILKAKGFVKFGGLYSRKVDCPKCEGKENVSFGDDVCKYCYGAGYAFDITSVEHEKYWEGKKQN